MSTVTRAGESAFTLIVAGNHQEYVNYVRRHHDLDMVHTRYIQDALELKNYQHPDIIFTGTWRDLPTADEIVEIAAEYRDVEAPDAE